MDRRRRSPPQRVSPEDVEQAGTIVFGSPKGLFTVEPKVEKPSPLTTVEKSETGHFWPHFLPDGATTCTRPGRRTRRADAVRRRARFEGSNEAHGCGDQRVALYGRGRLWLSGVSSRGDGVRAAVRRRGLHLHGRCGPDRGRGWRSTLRVAAGSFDVSRGDVLVYFQGGGRAAAGLAWVTARMQLGWVRRTGPVARRCRRAAPHGDFDLSPDGGLVAVTRTDGRRRTSG